MALPTHGKCTVHAGIQKVCIVGYCYGMPIAIHFARQAGAVSAFAVAHGAIKLPDDVKQLQAPGFFACAEKDPMLPASARGHLQALITYAIQSSCSSRWLLPRVSGHKDDAEMQRIAVDSHSLVLPSALQMFMLRHACHATEPGLAGMLRW